MKCILTLCLFLFGFLYYGFGQVNSNSTYVNGYYKQNGTYVQGYYRTTQNSTINDNYSTYPNVNPYTGTQGTIQPTYSYPTYSAPKNNYYNNYTYPTYTAPRTNYYYNPYSY